MPEDVTTENLTPVALEAIKGLRTGNLLDSHYGASKPGGPSGRNRLDHLQERSSISGG